jgi:prepilin-type N-terminal cleavage/methylation domain-containing protein
MAPTRRPASRALMQAFTLIELLVVIAIIAILTAILLPVFASVREGARQSTSISNMKDIQQKMAQFKLDNHRYPDVLFGYAVPNSSLQNALATAQNNDKANGTNYTSLYFPGLYPAYIKDPQEFTDPNNTVNSSDTGQYASQLTTNIVAPCNAPNDEVLSGASSSNCTGATPGNAVGTARNFYLADAYDSSPVVTGTNTVSTGSNAVRYQLAREATVANGATADADYNYQLRWQNPPASTLITVTTYHVKNADKVIAMFESGAVKKITGSNFAALEGPSTAPTFWKVNSTWPANLQP